MEAELFQRVNSNGMLSRAWFRTEKTGENFFAGINDGP
jgi:hypothetical protein